MKNFVAYHNQKNPKIESLILSISRIRTRLIARTIQILVFVLALFQESIAQISYSQNFDVNSTGWTGGGTAPTGAFARFTGSTACGGVGGSMRRNVYTAGTNGSLVSPAIPNNVGASVTLNYSYKVRNWSANTIAVLPSWGKFTVSYSTTGSAGPWVAIDTVENEPQISEAACIPKSHEFTPPASANIWFRWSTIWSSGDYYLNFDDIVITQVPNPCAGIPAPGKTLSSTSSVCPGGNVNLTLQNYTPGFDVAYQWQSSPDSVLWEDVNGATQSSYTALVQNQTLYRCIVTCAGNSSASIPVAVNTSFIDCYCSSVASNAFDTEILNVTLGSLNNTSNCSVAATGPGSILNRYANYRNLAPVSIDKIVPQSLSVLASSCSATLYDHIFKVFIDGNQDGDFVDAGEEIYVSPALPFGTAPGAATTATVNIPGAFLDGVTGMRVVLIETTNPASITPCAAYTYGETEDFLINLTSPAFCTTTPNPSVTISSIETACNGTNFTLSLTNTYDLSGYAFRWQSSPDNQTWNDIQGELAASSTFTTNQTESNWYRCRISCDFGGAFVFSDPILVTNSSSSATSLNIAACNSYTWNGATYTQSGTYTWTGNNAAGCDSVVTLNLIITSQPEQPQIACWQSANFNTSTCSWDVTGTQPAEPTNLACWQTANFNTTTCSWDVIGTPAPAIVTNASACVGYTWEANGETYSASGQYSFNSNCQDYTLNLIINQPSSETINASITQGESYSFNGQSLTTAGTYTATLQNTAGCDSMVTLNLEVNPIPVNCQASSNNNLICQGESTALIIETNANPAGTNNQQGFFEDFNDCNLDNFTFSGGTISITQNAFEGSCAVGMTHYAGEAPNNFYPSGLNFHYGTYSVIANATAFISDNYMYLFQGDNLEGGLRVFSLPNNTDNPGFYVQGLGIDYYSSQVNVSSGQWYEMKVEVFPSIINVYINSELKFSTTQFVAPSPGRFKLGVAFSGNYDNMRFIPYGNPSNILWSTGETTQSITVSPSETTTYSVTVTQGNQTCTSEVTINVNQPSAVSETVSACNSYTWNGNTYTQSGTYTWTGNNASGCDSVVTLNLTITPQPEQPQLACWQSANFNTTTCSWDVSGTQPAQPTNLACWQSANFNTITCSWDVTGTPAPALVTNASACVNYTWAANSETYSASGQYSFNSNCQDYTLNLIINQPSSETINASINEGQSYSFNGQSLTTAGTYTATLQNAAGCDSTVTLNLSVVPAPPAGCYAATVVDFSQGLNSVGLPVEPARSHAIFALGAPEAVVDGIVNFVSLGFGGSITLAFEAPVANGAGADIRIDEATWGVNPCNRYPETADVFASQDGINFVYLGRGCQDMSLDLGPLSWAQYIRITDVSDILSFRAGSDGYDVNGIECLNGTASITGDDGLVACSLQEVVSYTPGNRKNGTPVVASRSNPSNALGTPQNNNTINFTALGFGGTLVAKFDYVVFNQPGNDLRITETSFGNPNCANYPEKARISMSLDNLNWVDLGEICQDGEVDLGTLPYAQYIKIQDASPLSSTRFSGTADGFDIDAVVGLNNGCGNTASRSAELDNISTADETPVMEAYPNPLAEETSIRFGNVQTETDVRIELFDASGRLVLSQNARIDAEQNVVIIPTANIAKGMYHLVVNTGNESFRERLVK